MKKIKTLIKLNTLIRRAVVFLLAVVMAFALVACQKKPSGDGESGDGTGTAPGTDTEITTPNETPDDQTGGDKSDEPDEVEPEIPEKEFTYAYKATTTVGYYGKITNPNVPRNKPVDGERNEGLAAYPKYGTNFNNSNVPQSEVISESSRLTATGTANAGGGGYTWMDENGVLYSGTRSDPGTTERQLYKHTASVDNYHGNVDDNEPRVEKEVTLRPRGYSSYSVTGIYAPPGEVIKIQISEADMDATGGLTIHIGQALYNGQANNIWAGKAMPRMPHLLNTMQVNKSTAVLENGVYTAYVGSFLGGPLYIRNTNAAFTVTISGGVEYPHFILGSTTKEEYNRLIANTSAPYFDLEVWNYGVLISGPMRNAARFSYDELYDAAVLWEKISTVTTTGNRQGIVLLFDPFVAAGAAVAFPGRSSVNCPEGWMSNSLDYNLMVTSGVWGNFHEYHHNFQGFGVGNGGEVTNNSLTLVSYALFTKISDARGTANYGAGGLSGWNTYTSATWALEETLKIARDGVSPSNGNQGLALYATLLHNFGPDAFIKTKAAGGGQSYTAYMNAWQNVTHNNMYYYFKDMLGGGVTENADGSYPMFVPVSCVFQTGRSYMYDGEKKYITTMRPYLIKDGEPFTIDLSPYTMENNQYKSGSIIVPDGFTYRVKSITTHPANGTIDVTGSQSAVYTPAENGAASGRIIVTLELTPPSSCSFEVEDVDLVLEFQPTKELNKTVLQRTVYSYATNDDMYKDATLAFNADFANYTNKTTIDHSNPTQNSNTDIWLYGDTDANHAKYPNAPEYYFAHDNEVQVLDGKLYFEHDGKYRVYLRGRINCALYFSPDGEDYKLGAKIMADIANSQNFRLSNPGTYFDIQFKNGTATVNVNTGDTPSYTFTGLTDNWLYIKEILIVRIIGTTVPFLGVGTASWTESMFTVRESHYNPSGETVESIDSADYTYTEKTYIEDGTAVAIERIYKAGNSEYFSVDRGNLANRSQIDATRFDELTEVKFIAPTSASYATAYRKSYELPKSADFDADYFYRRSYTYGYSNNVQLGVGEQSVVAEKCANLNLHTGWGGNDLSVVVDGDRNSGNAKQLHTSTAPSAEKPFTLVIDLGKVYTANRLTVYSQGNRTDPQFPKAVNLYGSLDGENFTLIEAFSDLTFNGATQTLNFDNTQLRYYKFEVTQSTNSYIIIRELEMWNMFEVNDGRVMSPDDDGITYIGNWNVAPAASTFGHVFVGGTDAKLRFEFTGTRLGIFSTAAFGKNFEVYIDENKVESIALKADRGDLTFLSDKLQNKKHHVEIVCTGTSNIDSIVTFS